MFMCYLSNSVVLQLFLLLALQLLACVDTVKEAASDVHMV